MDSPSRENMLTLVVNAGSATLKLSLFSTQTILLKATIDRLDATLAGNPHAVIQNDKLAKEFDGEISAKDSEQALQWFFNWLDENHPAFRPSAAGHRVVHGGDRFSTPELVTPDVLRGLEELIHLAPLHQPHNLGPIRALMDREPSLPQVVCFDTAFHSRQSRLERTYALPREYYDKGVKKYGFHGLSYEYITSQLQAIDSKVANGRTIICHLGSGASICAVHAGRSVASSMGFTALEGLTMGTRCGSIDPGVLLYLLAEEELRVSELNTLLYNQSGLLGLSGISSDMRDLLASMEPSARHAVDHFCYRIAKEIGSMVPILGGLDTVVFTGGIGEHAPEIREHVCNRIACFGAKLDLQANGQNNTILHCQDSNIGLFVIPTNEELMIAQHTRRLISAAGN